MSKTALDMFTKCMAVELGPKRIRVNSVKYVMTICMISLSNSTYVSPGAIRTQFMQRRGVSDSEAHSHWDRIGAKYPVGRAGEGEDIASAVAFLASDASSFTTGTILLVDGGHIAANVAIVRD